MPVPTATSGDAIQATINVSIAQSRRLVSSWLPPPTPEEIASQKTEEQLAKEDAELFAPMPPRLGLGAPVPKDFLQSTDPKARKLAVSANEALRRKIMGRGRSSMSNQEASKPRPRTVNDLPNTGDNDDDEEEEGRSSLGKPKRRKLNIDKRKEEKDGASNGDGSDSGSRGDKEGGDEGGDKGASKKATKVSAPPFREGMAKAPSKGPVRFGTYLDVHKAEKARKKKKKKKPATN